MGKFALDNHVQAAAKMVAGTLPAVKIGNATAHVPPVDFTNTLALTSAYAKASEFLNVNGKTNVSSGFMVLMGYQIMIGESLMDPAGNPLLTDEVDMRAFLGIIATNSSLKSQIEGHSGLTNHLETALSIKPSDKQEPTEQETQEALLGNSSTQSPSE
jgi:hypothetical protein